MYYYNIITPFFNICKNILNDVDLLTQGVPYVKEECYLNNQFGDNLFDNHHLQRKSSIDTKP